MCSMQNIAEGLRRPERLWFLVAGEQLYIYLCPSVSQSVSGHNSASAGARKLKFGMKDACSRISRPFFHFFKFPIF